MTIQAPGEHVSGSAANRFVYDVFVLHAEAAADCKLTMHVQSLVKLDFRDPSRTLADA